MAKYVLEAVENSPVVYVKDEETGKTKGQYTSLSEAGDAVVALNKAEEAKTKVAAPSKPKKSKPKKSIVNKVVDKIKGTD